MGEFVVRLHSTSRVRLCEKPYDSEDGRKCLFLGLPHTQIAVFDQFRPAADEVSVPDGLTILVQIAAPNINDALLHAAGVADHTFSMMSCVALASIDPPRPIWAYDASPGLAQRDYRHCVYEAIGPLPTRPLNTDYLLHLLDKNYQSFLTNAAIKDDFKRRIQRAMMAFRRGLADNDDVLNEFLAAWSNMEGLDCVYTKLLPAASVRNFKDGMKDALKRLDRADVFDQLERLRNDIAHGSLSLLDATTTAHAHVELVRKALVLMILRILNADEGITKQILSRTSYKGKFPAHSRLIATIDFDPVDLRILEGQPQVKVWVNGEEFVKTGETLSYKPDIRFQPQNLKGFRAFGVELWGEQGAPLKMNDLGAAVIPKQPEFGTP
jgi:hypothetical protein